MIHNKYTKRVLIGLIVFLFSGMVFAGGGKDGGNGNNRVTESPDNLLVGAFRGPTGVGMVQLMDQGLELPGGGALDFQLVGAPDVMVARLLNREVDIAVLPINLAAKLYNSGQPLVLAGIVGTGMLSVVSSRTDVREIRDLSRMEVYTAGQGSTPDYVLTSIFAQNNLKVNEDVLLNYSMAYPEITASLIAGRIETAVLPEPFATMVTMQNPGVQKVINLQEQWSVIPGNSPTYPMTALVIRRDILISHPLGVKSFLNAYKDSLEWVLMNTQAAGELVTKMDLGIPGPVAARAIPVSGYVYYPGNSTEAFDLSQGLFSVLLNLDPPSIGGRLPDEAFYLD